jgi:hypothetical protein
VIRLNLAYDESRVTQIRRNKHCEPARSSPGPPLLPATPVQVSFDLHLADETLWMSMTEEQQRTNPLKVILFSVFAVVALYVLSVGPAARYYRSSPPVRLLQFYAPLTWLADNTPLGTPLRSYLDLWVPKPKPDAPR